MARGTTEAEVQIEVVFEGRGWEQRTFEFESLRYNDWVSKLCSQLRPQN